MAPRVDHIDHIGWVWREEGFRVEIEHVADGGDTIVLLGRAVSLD